MTWAEANRLAVTSHLRDLAILRSSGRRVHRLPDDRRAGGPAGRRRRRARRTRRCSSGASRRSPTAPRQLFREMDFSFLFDPTRKLFSIGFRVRDGTLDPSYYDLLASEARLASFLAIAKGDVAADHWFRLGRALTPVGRGSALISWSGSMFEYLMPALVMRAPARSLLDQTYRLDRRPPDELRRPSAACRGASRSRRSTRATSSRPTSTRASACPASA